MNRLRPSIILSYLAIYTIWGSTYFFISLAVRSISPGWLMAIRFLFGGVALMVIPVLQGQVRRWPSGREWAAAVFMGFFLLIMGNGLVTLAEMTVDSYVVALIIAAVPFMVAFYDRLFHRRPLPLFRLAGAALGILGVGLFLYDGQSLASSFRPGILLALGAMLCWSFGTSWSHRLPKPTNNFFFVGMQMLFAGLTTLVFSLVQGPDPVAMLQEASSLALWSTVYLTVIGALGIAAYNYLLIHEPAFRITSYALVNPVIAVFLGLVLGAESATPYLFFGFPLILAGLTVMLYGPSLWKRIRKNPAPAVPVMVAVESPSADSLD